MNEPRASSVLCSVIFEVIFMIMSLSQRLLTLCVYFRKPFLGLQGHNSPAFVPSGHLAVRKRHAHSEHRDSCLVGRCRQNLLLQRRQVCVELFSYCYEVKQSDRTGTSQYCEDHRWLKSLWKSSVYVSKLTVCYQRVLTILTFIHMLSEKWILQYLSAPSIQFPSSMQFVRVWNINDFWDFSPLRYSIMLQVCWSLPLQFLARISWHPRSSVSCHISLKTLIAYLTDDKCRSLAFIWLSPSVRGFVMVIT